MAALSLVSSVAGLLFLLICTGEMVQCMSMHKDMFNNFMNKYMDKFMKLSRNMSVCMRVNRLHGDGGIVLWASQS
jgi:aromatic ring hydroxylase